MEANIQSNQMDLDKEEAKPGLDLESSPQERHVWRIPEFPPHSPRNISVPGQILVHRSQERGVGNMTNPLEGGYELLFTHQEKTIELLGGWNLFSFKDKVKKRKNWLKSQSLLSIDQKRELEMTPALDEEGPVASTSSSFRSVQKQAQRTSEEERSQGQRQIQLAQTLPTRVEDPQIRALSHVKHIKYGQNSYGIHSQAAGKDKQDFSIQIMD
ncbi:hypothetical protein O181_001486 [Austropuccinia psidii MF-1]|uniref:Uncharacterized protein n=1 Tax=Austropuccinia psidii MF-1 TaxID=1389203 RepID=A0A9Q3GCG2_9BASI|nr:hypothetical protein [Austropuccinia psidii MF-1]